MKIKRLIISPVIILFFFVSHAQLIMIDSETGEYKYEDVVSTEGRSQQQLQNRAIEWYRIYYDDILSENDSLIHSELDSLSSLKKLVKYRFIWKFISKNIPIELFYDIEIKTKDNRYKYTLSDFRVGKISLGHLYAVDLKTYIERFPQKYQILIEEPIDTEMIKVLESLEYFMNNGEMMKEDDDW
ncbi:MAG: hypothetical protein ABFR05_09460 [Bacteroidota bacterium]